MQPESMRPESTLFEKSVKGKRAIRFPSSRPASDWLEGSCLRQSPLPLPELSELEVVRHFTRLSQKNFSIDTHFYPLGSCTMKYNPKVNDQVALGPSFSRIHPLQPSETIQGFLKVLHELERGLCALTGMEAFTLQPSAGAQGELVGVLMAKAYHEKRGEKRTEVLIPDSAHGTNPATASLGKFKAVTVKSGKDGRVDPQDLARHLGPRTAVVMLTVPNTLGLFEEHVLEISRLVHEAGALLYMDGANFNALAGLVRPADLGFDMVHLNLHKTFSTPHGGGGPGAGPVGVKSHLIPFLPSPRVLKKKEGCELSEDFPDSIGRVRAFFGNTGVLLRAYCYLRRHSCEEFRQIAEAAILHANYLRVKLQEDYPAYVKEPCMHECVLQPDAKKFNGLRTLDVAKRLLDYGFYAPTVYFPLIVPEALMIEPTETESKSALDSFIRAMKLIAREAREDPEKLRRAPTTTPVRRLDEVKAAREPNLRWK